MPNFILAYHGGTPPSSEEEGKKMMAAWMAWFETMGDAVVDGGNPVGQSATVSKAGVVQDGGANPLSGYSIISAPDQAAACEIAKGCPILEDGAGSVEVAEIHEI